MKFRVLENATFANCPRFGVALVLLTGLLAGLVAAPVYAATITVTNANDSGAGSLRQAIADSAAGGTIKFDGDYTILLGSHLIFDMDLTIDGTGHTITLSGQNACRVMVIGVYNGPPNGTRNVTLKYLNIVNGKVNLSGALGAGIYTNRASLTVQNCTFANNFVGDTGGAIYIPLGNLTVDNSTFSNNTAQLGSGGAIYFTGSIGFNTLIVRNSTFSGNSALYYGGAIYHSGAEMTVDNCTLSGNISPSAGAGIYNDTGGIFNRTNTIIANSSGSVSTTDCFNATSWTGTNSYTLVKDGSCSPTISGDPLLGSLANNGGPTQTMALLPGSPAINAGGGCSATDQRGVSRPQGSRCDIGAYEADMILVTANNKMINYGDSEPAYDFTKSPAGATFTTQPTCSVAGPHSNAGSYTISCSGGVPTDSKYMVEYATGTLTINKLIPTATLAVTNSPVTYDGSPHGAAVGISSSSVSGSVSNISTGGSATKTNAGTYAVTASFVPADSTNYNTLNGLAAGNFVISKVTPTATLTVNNSPVSYDGNTHAATVGITTSSIAGTVSNIRTGGAALQTNVGTYAVLADFIPNDTTNYDSLPNLAAGNFVIECVSSLAVTNANDTGAGSLRQAMANICAGGTITFAGDYSILLASTLTIDKNMTINGVGHSITLNGQATVRVFVVNTGVTASLNLLTITNSGTIEITGGAVANNGTLTLTNSTFAGNFGNLGTVYSNGTLTVNNCTFSGNHVVDGGGIFNDTEGTLNLTNSTFSGNSASWEGGSLFNYGSIPTFANNIIANSTLDAGHVECWTSVVLTSSTNNLVEDGTCLATLMGDPALGVLGNYGGRIQTFAPLPGSPVIDAGAAGFCSATDQRGKSRVGTCDIGAFESQGFTLAITGGNNQSAFTGAAFVNPLQVSITSNGTPAEPVDGGLITYTPPSSGASATLSTNPVTIASGGVSTSATANATVGGPYAVNANTRGAGAGVDFSLTNALPCYPTSAVTNSNDSGAGSLRQAIADACVDGSITFAAGLSGQTIVLSSQLMISSNLTIDGSALASQVTISGNNTTRVFNNGVTVTLKNLKIANGHAEDGGGVVNHGTLTVTNCTLSGNSATNRAGALYSTGALFVNNSTLSGNSAADGGGVINYGTLSMTNCTLSGNSANSGGGITNNNTMTLKNCTISGNTSSPSSYVVVSNSGAVMSYTNTIITNSTGNDCGNYEEFAVGANNNNLVSDYSCSYQGVNYRYGWAGLGPLGNNGGPTQTLALLPGSQAIDTGTNSGCPATDQRGATRPYGSTCDIGAYEYYPKAITGFTISGQVGDTTINDGAGTIALVMPVGTDLTSLAPSVTFTGNSVNPNSGVTQNFTNPVIYTVTAGDGTTKAYTVSVTYPLSTTKAITAFTIPSQVGGTVINEGAGTISFVMPYGTDVTALVPTITHTGKSINPASGVAQNFTSPVVYTVTAEDSSTKAYTVTVSFVCASAITVANANNSGPGSLRQAIADICSGGTITFTSGLSGSTIPLASQLFVEKNMTIDGAGLATPIVISGQNATRIFYVRSSAVATMNSLKIANGNSGAENGAAIVNDHSNLTLTNCTVSTNDGAEGGGINNYFGTLTMSNCTVAGNHSTFSGGAIYNYTGTITMTNCTMSGNSAGAYGGAYYNYGVLTLTNSTLSGNSAANLGGLYNEGGGTLHMSNTIIANSISSGDCANSGTISTNTNNLVEDGGCSPALSGDPLLNSIGSYGGNTQTFPLLPGSKAIDAGDSATCAAALVNGLDQRGVARPLACDIGAFESQGFTLTKTGGDNQSTLINTAFGDPLVLTVTSSLGEPVEGGKVTLAAPSSGASTNPTGYTLTIASGVISQTVTANSIVGAYNMTASTKGAATDVNFALRNRGVPVITWSNPANIVYGTALGATQLNASASVTGTFVYTPLAGTVLSAGPHTLHADFTPDNTADYTNADKDVSITVTQATPAITWNNPADIVYGTALGASQLNATADVTGAFTYTPPTGTVLAVGTHGLKVDFVPDDATNYKNASKTVSINVIQGGFYPLTPCRVFDTRVVGPLTNGQALSGPDPEVYEVRNQCGIPATAKAIVANVTVVNGTAAGELNIIAGDGTPTGTSLMYIPVSRARANNGVIQLATNGAGTIQVINGSTGTVHVILDVNGYFQ